MKLNKDDLIFFSIIAAIIFLFFYSILGVAGVLSVLVIILIFIVPSYLIMGNFNLEEDEKVIFYFFISTGIFPIFSYWMGLFISFKIAIVITFILLIALGILLRKFKKNKSSNPNNN